jgi:RimJ/RimL family protein N-acetyltransferase
MTTSPVTIRTLSLADRDAALAVINAAAVWYGEIQPSGELSDVEMTVERWAAESERMTWFGAFADGALIGVVGLEYAYDVALLRHWYVLPDRQRSGAGTLLRQHLEASVVGVGRIVAGTYEANYKARGALEGAGYALSADSQAVLRRYYDIPADRRDSSVTYERAVGR